MSTNGLSVPPPKYHWVVVQPRPLQLSALFISALLIRLMWVPTWSRLAFEGHERLYLNAFEGQSVGPSTAAFPALTLLYGGLGKITQDPRALVVFSAIIGSLGVVGLAVWVSRELNPRMGLWAGALAVMLPEHAAWSTSAYNVILPNTLLIWAMALGGRWAVIGSALAGMIRVETVFLAPFAGWRGLVGGLIGVGVTVWSGVEFPQIVGGSAAFDVNLPMLRFIGPPVLLLGLMGVRGPRGLRLLGMVVWVHIVGATFEDYGARHALLGGMLMLGLVANARWTWVPMLAAVGLAVSTMSLRDQWHALDDGTVAAEADGLGAPPTDCVEVTEEPTIPGQVLPSHVRFARGDLESPCVIWGEEFWHRGWSSRGLMDRATRMRTLYKMEPVGALVPGGGAPVRLFHRLEPRW